MIKPNLPCETIKTAIISECISERIEFSLSNLGINPVKLSGRMNCDIAVKNHSDLYVIHLDENNLFLAKNICSLAGETNFPYINVNINLYEDDIKYPQDVFFNAVVLGKKLLCSKRYLHSTVLEFASNNEFDIIDFNQGYAKCNICPVNENSVITEDSGIAKVLNQNGFEVLLLEKHGVCLAGYKYGFIGGASGKISEDKLAFLGDVRKHPEYDRIQRFLYKRDVEDISLSDEPLSDYGSLLPVI